MTASDIILYILDSRDPLGTFFRSIQKKIKNANKKLIIILNKCDLVPSWITSSWIKILSNENFIIPFNSIENGKYGKGSIMNIIRQMKSVYFSKKKNLIIGVIGYPNVGKSSLINTLKGEKAVKTSLKGGETKVWQFVKLFKKIFIIDSPGIIHYLPNDSPLKIFREGFFTQKTFFGEIFEIFSTVETIDQLMNVNRFKENFPIFKNRKVFRSLLEEGTNKKNLIEVKLKLKKFFNGDLSWFAPLPRKILKKYKIFNKKLWFTY